MLIGRIVESKLHEEYASIRKQLMEYHDDEEPLIRFIMSHPPGYHSCVTGASFATRLGQQPPVASSLVNYIPVVIVLPAGSATMYKTKIIECPNDWVWTGKHRRHRALAGYTDATRTNSLNPKTLQGFNLDPKTIAIEYRPV